MCFHVLEPSTGRAGQEAANGLPRPLVKSRNEETRRRAGFSVEKKERVI